METTVNIIKTDKIEKDIKQLQKDYLYFYRATIFIDLNEIKLSFNDLKKYFDILKENNDIGNYVIIDAYDNKIALMFVLYSNLKNIYKPLYYDTSK